MPSIRNGNSISLSLNYCFKGIGTPLFTTRFLLFIRLTFSMLIAAKPHNLYSGVRAHHRPLGQEGGTVLWTAVGSDHASAKKKDIPMVATLFRAQAGVNSLPWTSSIPMWIRSRSVSKRCSWPQLTMFSEVTNRRKSRGLLRNFCIFTTADKHWSFEKLINPKSSLVSRV